MADISNYAIEPRLVGVWVHVRGQLAKRSKQNLKNVFLRFNKAALCEVNLRKL